MRLNFIGGQSVTGGAGALTLTEAEGLALPSLGFIDGQMVDYSVIEYTDATRATIAKAETGVGTVSSNVLTRSAPRTAWDGTTYLQASPSAISFAASNVRVYCSPTAEGGPTAFPARPDLSASYGPNGYVMGANLTNPFDLASAPMTANRQYMVPLKLEAGFPLTQIGVEVTTAVAASTVHCAIASCHPTTGMPGRILAVANILDSTSTGFKLNSITSRLFPPGWYWQLISSDAAVAVRGAEQFLPNSMGINANRIQRGVHRGRAHAAYTVGDDAMAGTSASYSSANNAPYPLIFMR